MGGKSDISISDNGIRILHEGTYQSSLKACTKSYLVDIKRSNMDKRSCILLKEQFLDLLRRD
jgi:hypothetical protein